MSHHTHGHSGHACHDAGRGGHCCQNHEHGQGHCHPKETKPGILLGLFGTTLEAARSGYDAFEASVRERFPGIPVFHAYTASHVRRKILAEENSPAPSVAQALTDMHDQGVTHVALQSLQVIPGVEYEFSCRVAAAMEYPSKGFQKIMIGKPLLNNRMLRHVALGVPAYLPADMGPDDVAVLVGHGSYHEAQIYLRALESELRYCAPRAIVGSLMGKDLELRDVMRKLKALGAKRVHLLPFMCVPGHHYVCDIAGDADSWASAITAHGWDCVCHATGALEHKAFANLWLYNLHVALVHLGEAVRKLLPPLPGHHHHE